MSSSQVHRLLKNLSFLPLCLALAACGGNGGDSDGGEQAEANTAPRAADDTASTDSQAGEITIDVLANDSDSDGDSLFITSASDSTQGVTPVVENGQIRYRLPDGFHGTDEFTYTISDGELEASATVTVTIDYALTVSGIIGETVSGNGTVSVMVGEQAYTASLDGNRYSAVIDDSPQGAVVSVKAEFSQTDIGKPIVLKSYVGSILQLEEAASAGAVSNAEMATLYLSAASTSAAAMLERSAGHEITTTEVLLEASQVLPQYLILDAAVTIKSVLAGDEWDDFTQLDTYELLRAYPTAINIAQSLLETDPARFEQYEAAVLGDSQQALPVAGYDNDELLFVVPNAMFNYPSGYALQLTGGEAGTGYLASLDSTKTGDNGITFTLSGLDTIVDTDGTFASQPFHDDREACAPDEIGSYQATRIKSVYRKYLDSAFFSAYANKDTFRCDSTGETFELGYYFAQVNKATSGDIRAATQGRFALDSYLERDPEVYSSVWDWHSVLVEPNAEGTVTQRFDFKSGYTDQGSIEYLGDGRMAIDTDRGDYIEYTPFGSNGSGLRLLGLLKRADGSVAAVNGSFLVPFTAGVTLPSPSRLVLADSAFQIDDPASHYFSGNFGLEFLADNTGNDLYLSGDTYKGTSSKFSWSEESGFLKLQYYYSLTEGPVSSCPDGDADCAEFRYREVEPLGEYNGDFYIRVYQESYGSAFSGGEPGTDVSHTSYIDRFSVLPN